MLEEPPVNEAELKVVFLDMTVPVPAALAMLVTLIELLPRRLADVVVLAVPEPPVMEKRPE